MSGIKFAESSFRKENLFVDKLISSLENLRASPLFSVILNIKTLLDLGFDYKKKSKSKRTFSKLKEKDTKKGKTNNKTSVGRYAFAKSYRGFGDTCGMIGVGIVDFIGNILAIIGSFIAGAGAIAGGIVKQLLHPLNCLDHLFIHLKDL